MKASIISFKILMIVFLIFMLSCGGEAELAKESQKVQITYRNGQVYCEGFNKVFAKSREVKHAVGHWKFVHLNGNLLSTIDYDLDGRKIKTVNYWLNGNIKSEIDRLNSTTRHYYESGKIESEVVTRIETESQREKEIDWGDWRSNYLPSKRPNPRAVHKN